MDNNMLPNSSSRATLTQIMVEVQTEGNTNTVKGFVGALREMLTKLVDAQAKHKKIHAKMMKQCTEEASYRKKEIATAKVSLAKAIASRTRCKASLDQAEKALPALVASHATYSKELARGRAARALEKKKYMQRKLSFKEGIEFLADFMQYVKRKLKNSFKAFGFIEMSENLVRHASRLQVMSEAAPVLVALASHDIFSGQKANNYTYNANEKLADKLNRLLNALWKRLNDDNANNDAEEKKAAAVFAVYEAKLIAIINTLAKNIKRVKKQIEDMQRCITTEDAVIASASAKISRNTTLMNNAARMCKHFNGEFIEATMNRLDEMKTMGDILKIVKRRFKDLPKDLVEYLETIKDGQQEYINSTEFKKFVEYERIQHAKNARGAAMQIAKNHVTKKEIAHGEAVNHKLRTDRKSVV